MFGWVAVLAFLPQAAAVDVTLPPAGAHVLYTTLAHGVQIYQCGPQDGGFQWVFQSPEAELIDATTREAVATHGAGPSWTWNDGSSVVGKVLQKRASEVPDSIPWLLLETHANGIARGALSGVAFVRRSDTQAGAAPADGCDAGHQGEVIRVPYAATYTFYSRAE